MSVQPRENELVIILADISGYTKFMVENQRAAFHGQLCITLLIESLLREVDIPLHLQEIEGDAIFLYAENPGDHSQWQQTLDLLRTKLLRFFEVFYAALVLGRDSTPCPCAICAHADELHLKIVVHSGRAVFHEIAGRPQVSGHDVILAHRLLKNSVPDEEYLLMSEAAYRDLGAQMGRRFIPGRERYDSIGDVATYVCFLDEDVDRARDEMYALNTDGSERPVDDYTAGIFPLFMRALWAHLRRPILPSSPLSRIRFALLEIAGFPFITPLINKRAKEKIKRRRAEHLHKRRCDNSVVANQRDSID